jgi:hypothetical protein
MLLKDAPRVLQFAAAMTIGILLALAVHIVTSRLGIGLASTWRDLFPDNVDRLWSVIAWWLIAGAAGFGSFATARLLIDPAAHRPRLHRMLLWGAGGAFLLLLLGAEHYGSGEAGIRMSARIVASLVALALGALMAFCGTHFALRR